MEENNNIGFIGSEGQNQYSNPYKSDLYSQPSIKKQAHRIAEENRRASKEFLTGQPIVPSNSEFARDQNLQYTVPEQLDITDLNTIADSNPTLHNSYTPATFEPSVTSSKATNNNKSNSPTSLNTNNSNISRNMDDQKNSQSQSFLLKNGTAIKIDDDDEKSLKPPRKRTVCCNCCPLWLCVSITIAILAIAGILTYIFWPKIPDVNITSITLANDPNAIAYNLSADGGQTAGIEIKIEVHTNVKNDNFYDLSVHNLNTRVFLQTDSLEKTLVGKGSKSDIVFPKHSTTEFVLPLTMGYYVNDIMKDDALLYLLKSCTSQEPIKIQYEVDIGIFVIESVFTPTYKGSQQFQCPVGQMGLADIANIGDGISNILLSDIYTSLSQYFSNFSI